MAQVWDQDVGRDKEDRVAREAWAPAFPGPEDPGRVGRVRAERADPEVL